MVGVFKKPRSKNLERNYQNRFGEIDIIARKIIHRFL